MKKFLIFSLLFSLSSLSYSQLSREEKLKQLQNRDDIKVTEVEKDLLKIEYPGGKVLYKNISDYKFPVTDNSNYSPNYDSTIIDLTTIDTTLYYQKYSFWQEVPLTNFDFDNLRIGDVNNNGKPELYGSRKFFESNAEPVTVYELNAAGNFNPIFQYDSSLWIVRNIYDVNGDGQNELHLTKLALVTPYQEAFQQIFFSKPSDTSLATELNFIFFPYEEQNQLNDQTLGDFDGDNNTDLIFARFSTPSIYIFEYNPIINNLDSVYRFDVLETAPWGNSGFSVADFDLDGKTDIVFGTGKGAVYVIENEGNNQYTNSWLGMVETYAAYVHTWTNDIDGNGKPEFWVLGDAFYNGVGITRITLFETNGDNSYQTVGRVDLIGVFSFYAGTMQAVDIDNDGSDEVAICIDGNFLILKFNGSKDHQTYEVYYIKQNELSASGQNSVYFGATVYDLLNNGENNILISLDHIIDIGGGNTQAKRFTQIYRPDSTTSVQGNENLVPELSGLYQNYPSPFNPITNIKFSLGSSTNSTIKIFNILGKEITTLLDEYLPAGEHRVQWEGKDAKGNILPGGVYFIQMIAGSYQKTIKTIFLK